MDTAGPWTPHLPTAKEIAKTFGVGLRTVREWRENGAPIVFIGKRLQANYYQLFEWLRMNQQKPKADRQQEHKPRQERPARKQSREKYKTDVDLLNAALLAGSLDPLP